MEKNMTKKKTLAEELGRVGDWFAERDLGVGDVLRRVVALGTGLVGSALALMIWALMMSALEGFIRDGHYSWIVLALGVGGAAVLATCGVLWLVWAIWTDEL